MEAKTLYYNGNILTGNQKCPRATFMLVRGERIEAVDRHASNFQLEYDHKVDLEGCTVVPGFNDSHLHLKSIGESLGMLKANDVKSRGQLQSRVEAYIKDRQLKPGDWVRGRGWNQNKFAKTDLPDHRLLDQVSPDNPVILKRACGHLALVNQVALEQAGITRATPDPEGGSIDRFADGEPTGILREKAMAPVERMLPEPGVAQYKEWLQQGMEKLVQSGLTSVQSDDFGNWTTFEKVFQAYQDLKEEGDLPLRVNLQVRLGKLSDFRRLVEERGLRTGIGDRHLAVGPCKILADGSMGGQTAALSQEYSDDPGNRGKLLYSPERLQEFIRFAHDSGFQLAVHGIGDRAIDLIIDAYRAFILGPPEKDFENRLSARIQQRAARFRPRIIHGQLTTPEQIVEIDRLGVSVDIQPIFLNSDLHIARSRLGKDRLAGTYAWKTMLETGIHLAGGSDGPVDSYKPLEGLYSAVTRKDLVGHPDGGWRSEEALSVEQALKIYTAGAAYQTFEEDNKGRLKPGLLADFVVLEQDPAQVKPENIKDIEVLATYVGGKCVYQA